MNSGLCEHCLRVAYLVTDMTILLGMDEKATMDVQLAAIYHDIGKTQIPEQVLNKPGKLTPGEYFIMKLHAEIGYRMIQCHTSPETAQMVLYHHEDYDGGGYFGLQGNDIPYGARILRICDVDEEVQDTGATASKDGVRTYVFGYKTKLLKGQKTSSLFDKIQMKNVIEDEILPDSANDIKVEGFAIQSEEILDKTGKDLTDELTTANLKTIYDIFIKQGTSYDAAHGTTTGHDYSGNEKDANTNNSKDVHGNNR